MDETLARNAGWEPIRQSSERLSPDTRLCHSLPIAVSAHDEPAFEGLLAFGEIG